MRTWFIVPLCPASIME